MPAIRLRSLSLLAAGVLVFGACNSSGSVPPPAAPARTAPDPAPAVPAGAPEIPDVVEGKFNVAMVLIGPHDDGG